MRLIQGGILRAAIVLVVLFGISPRAHGATIDLNSLNVGAQGTVTLVFPEATLTSGGTDFYIGAAGIDHEVCALATFGCQADLTVDFSSSVSNLSFVTSGWDPGDLVTARIFGAGNVLLGTVVITSDTTVSFGPIGGIVRLFLDDASTGAGIAYDDFSFDQAAAVPEPASLLLLGTGGLGMLAKARRRRKQQLR